MEAVRAAVPRCLRLAIGSVMRILAIDSRSRSPQRPGQGVAIVSAAAEPLCVISGAEALESASTRAGCRPGHTGSSQLR